MLKESKSHVTSAKDSIASTMKDVGEMTATVVDTVTNGVLSAITHAGEVGGTISHVVHRTFLGVAEAGGDVGSAAKDTVLGVPVSYTHLTLPTNREV